MADSAVSWGISRSPPAGVGKNKVTLTSSGSFTANAQLAGNSYALKGAFDAQGATHSELKKGSAVLATIDLAALPPQLAGSMAAGSSTLALSAVHPYTIPTRRRRRLR